MVEWLAGRDYGPEEIEEAVGRLIEEGLLDDERFARLFAEDKRDLSGWGPERIAAGLRDHGIDRRLIEEVCEASYGEHIERAAELLGLRGLPLDDDPARDRALGFLTRRGYGYEVSHDAIRRAEEIADREHGGADRRAAQMADLAQTRCGPMIEAVLFDIDGTLLDHDRAGAAALRAALEFESPGFDEGRQAAALDEWRRLEELHYGEYLSGAIAIEEQRRRRAAGILAWLDAEPRPAGGLDRWFADFLSGYRQHWALFDDVEPLLAQLERRGLALGAITNALESLQRRKLAALGLERRLPTMIASSTVGAAKPSAEIFAAACAALELPAERVAYVGDRLDTDARGARDAGLLGIWLNRDRRLPVAGDVATIGALDELIDLI